MCDVTPMITPNESIIIVPDFFIYSRVRIIENDKIIIIIIIIISVTSCKVLLRFLIDDIQKHLKNTN